MELEELFAMMRKRPYIFFSPDYGEEFSVYMSGYFFYFKTKGLTPKYRGRNFKEFANFLSKKYSDEDCKDCFELMKKYEKSDDEKVFLKLLSEYDEYLEKL